MSSPSGSSRRPLRLVQPYDESSDASTASASRGAGGVRWHHSAPQLPRLDVSASQRATPAHSVPSLPRSYVSEMNQRRELDKEPPPSSRASLSTLPSHSRPVAGTNARPSTPSSAAALSSPAQVKNTSSVDRLSALYQQYQGSVVGRGDTGLRVTTPTPSSATPHGAPLTVQSSASVDPRGSEMSSVTSNGAPSTSAQSSAEATPIRGHAGGYLSSERDASQLGDVHGQPAVRPLTNSRQVRSEPPKASPSQPPRASAMAHQAPTNATTLSSMLRALPQRQDRVAVLPSAALSTAGVSGLMRIAVGVWAVLGFFELRPSEGRSGDGGASSLREPGRAAEERTAAPMHGPPSGPQETEEFLVLLHDYLQLTCSEDGAGAEVSVAAYAAALRSGLWRVLFNAVFYCITALDGHRRLSPRETEVRTGGEEDAYEVVFPSSSSSSLRDDDSDAAAASAQREAPVRLTWRVPGETAEELAARRMRDPLPPGSPLWRAWSLEASYGSDAAGFLAAPSRIPVTELYGGALRTPPSASDWYFTLRCLAQVGYARDALYLQTPSDASPAELLLALLWLTQQYKLVAVAEYVELNRRYAFLLQFRVEETPGGHQRSPAERGAPAAARDVRARERLLSHLSNASVWPPVGFDEGAAIELRLQQLERCLGKGDGAGAEGASAGGRGVTPTGPSSGALQVRRLMAVRRLISLSLNRLHHALQRQAEQTIHLGLHSPLDAQLCSKRHHALYEDVMAALAHVQATERRLQSATAALARAGSLVAFLLRYEECLLPAEEVLLALEEDDATWLDRPGGGVDESRDGQKSPPRASAGADRWRRAVRRGVLPDDAATVLPTTTAAALAQSLSTFRATHARNALSETWKRLLRRSHVAPQSISPENLRFLLDVEAQQVQEARVRENMQSRYSLQAALAAETAVLGYERQQQQQRRRRRASARSSPGVAEADISISSRRTAMTDAEASLAVPPVRVALPTMALVTSAANAFAQLRAEEAAYGPVTLGTAEVQLTEVGQPAAGSTTSAKLELLRLHEWGQELDAQLGVHAQTETRVAHCKRMLETLYQQFGLRMATPIVPRAPAK